MAKKPTPAELSVVYRDVRTLIPYARNARQHSPEQAQIIAGLMREFGWTNPILLDGKRGVVAGHGRIDGARLVWEAGGQIGHTPKPWFAPCIDVTGWTEAQKRAYVIADNASAERASWNDEMRALELAELREAGFDLLLTALPEDDVSAILAKLDAGGPVAPEDFATYDVDVTTHYKCPSCGYEWSGKTGKEGSDEEPAAAPAE